ncbi:MAG: glycosyltransferase family 4 protein [Bacteroidota bacterium]
MLIVGPAWPLRAGGMATFNEQMAYSLQEQGHQVEIITFSMQYPSWLFPGKTQMSDEPAPEGLNIRVLLHALNPINWLITARYVRQYRADYLILRYWMPFMAPCLGMLSFWSTFLGSKAIRIALADNIIPHESFPLSRVLTKFFLAQTDSAATLSDSVRADLMALGYRKPSIRLKHPLYDNFGAPVDRETACNTLGLDPGFTYFLFFGFIRAYKGLDLLLEAFADERLRSQNVKLIVAGEFYESPDRYNRIIRERNLAPHLVLLTRFIRHDEVRFLFSAAQLVTQTYHHATQSGVTQIGFHYHTPMLVTDVGGLAELVDHDRSGYVCPPNPEKIADHMIDFMMNKRYAEMSAHVAVKKQEFSWEEFVRKLLSSGSPT